MKRLVTILSIVFLASSINYAAISSEADEQWIEPDVYQDGHFSIVFKDSIKSFNQFPMLQGFKNVAGVQSSYLCRNITQENCAQSDFFQYTALLPICTNTDQSDCIESLSAISESGQIDEGKFSKYIYGKHPNAFDANGALKIPKTESPGVWNFASAKHAYGGDYALAIGVGTQTSLSSPQYPSNLFAYLYPVSVQKGIGELPRNKDGFTNIPECIEVQSPTTGKMKIGCTGGGSDGLGKYNCPFQLDVNRDCLLQHEFPSNYKFQISFRLSDQPSGWLYGRLLDPSITISDIVGGGSRIVVMASPTKVPVLYAGDSWSTLGTNVQDYYLPCIKLQTCMIMSRQPRIDGPHTDPLLLNAQRWPEATDPTSFDELKLWLPTVNDTMSALPSAWNFKMTSKNALNNSNACFRDGTGLKGIVTTNATLYSESPPVLINSTLQYKVAAPHYNKNGSDFKGTYNLVMRSDIARCIYGFTSAPIQAVIEVVTENGTESVATTSINEKDGWLSLSAYNFGFSAPTIKATLKQSIPTPAVSATPEASISPVTTNIEDKAEITTEPITGKKRTIVCYKGKVFKKITAVKPICPKGYKKK